MGKLFGKREKGLVSNQICVNCFCTVQMEYLERLIV